MQAFPIRPTNSKPDKRALFVVITDYPGGSERISFALASELSARPGWNVEVKIVSAQLPNSFSKRALSPDVRVSYGPVRNWFLAFPLLPFRLLFRRYDLVFTTLVYNNALISIMRRLRLMRIEYLVARESMPLFDWFGGAKTRLFQWLYRAYGGEDLLIAQTQYMAEHVRPWLPEQSAEKLRTLPNPVNFGAILTSAAAPLEPELSDRLKARPTVLFCGWLNDRKRPLTALRAFERLVRAGFDVQIAFLGSGPLAVEVREQASHRGLADRVLLLGHRTDPYAVMAACEYGLITSGREGFPNVILEMMACGLRKIITTPCAGDLEQLPAVAVTRGYDDVEIAEALISAFKEGEDCGQVYTRFAATRSVPAYLDAFLRLT